jgi:hypothetical protein
LREHVWFIMAYHFWSIFLPRYNTFSRSSLYMMKKGNLVTSNWLWKHNELDTLVIVFKDDVQNENSRDEVLTTYQLNYMFVQTIHFWRSLCHYCLRLVKVALNFNTNLKFVQFVVDQNSNVLIISRAMSKGFRDFISFFQIFCL